jgi:hypothetical protein
LCAALSTDARFAATISAITAAGGWVLQVRQYSTAGYQAAPSTLLDSSSQASTSLQGPGLGKARAESGTVLLHEARVEPEVFNVNRQGLWSQFKLPDWVALPPRPARQRGADEMWNVGARAERSEKTDTEGSTALPSACVWHD